MIASTELDQLQTLIRSRRSVRRFLPKSVPTELIIQIIETAIWSPSAHNRQPWRFIVLQTDEKKKQFVDRMGDLFLQDLLADGIPELEADQAVQKTRGRVMTAPVAILLSLDTAMCDIYPDHRRSSAEHIMGVQSVAMAGNTLLLAAHAAGLGGVWLCAPLFVPELATTMLNLPVDWEPQGLILLGYPASIPDARSRHNVEEVIRFI